MDASKQRENDIVDEQKQLHASLRDMIDQLTTET
jgi:hypothetical protein